MSCLDIHTKIAMMLEQIRVTKKMLKDNCLRPSVRERLVDELKILKRDVKQLYYDLFKVISN